MSVLPFPAEVPCHNCSHPYVGATCAVCGEDRPALRALKAMSADLRASLPKCRYYPKDTCTCSGRGFCVSEAA